MRVGNGPGTDVARIAGWLFAVVAVTSPGQAQSWNPCSSNAGFPCVSAGTNVGIGTLWPGATLDVEAVSSTPFVANALNVALSDTSSTPSTPGGPTDKFGLVVSYSKTGSEDQSAGYENAPVFATGSVSAGILAMLTGVDARLQVTGGTVTSEANFLASADYGGGGAGTVGTRAGLQVADLGRGVGIQYGVLINPLTSGVNNYAIYAAGGNSYFGGNVGIGTTGPIYPLSVKGTIGAGEVVVTNTSGWSDYVFAPGYRLAPLSEVGEYVRANGHLPEIPSAAEVAEKGVSVGDMQAKLLAKVEELTLHMIAAEERAGRLAKENAELRERVGRLEVK